MKKVLFSLLCMMLLTTAASAQVKTFKTVVENDTMVVNASDCIDRSRNNYLLWVRYDYKNLKICKKAVASEKAAEKQIQKASQQTAKLQQKKDKAEKAAIKAQQKAANADKKIAAAEQKLIKAKQDAEKAYSAVEKSKSAVENVQTDTGIAEATIQKAQEQKAAAKKMILNGIIVRRDGSSGSQR